MFKFDYHVHTQYSHDSTVSLEDYCLRAIELGLNELGFSDHLDLDPKDPGCGYFDWRKFSDDFSIAKGKFDGQITLRKGIEITYQEEFRDTIEETVGSGEFDYTMSGI